MKLTVFILLISLMQVSASSFGQQLTMRDKNASIDKIFKEIRIQTGYSVILRKSELNTTKNLAVDFNKASLDEVMDKVLEGTEMTFSIEEKNIWVKKKDKPFFDKVVDRFNAIDVRGRVIDGNGKPLAGATIKVKGSGVTMTTNLNGEFKFINLTEKDVIIISYVGFETREIEVIADLGNITLTASLSKLDEVQVIAYGTTTRRLNTGNITSVKSKDIESQPINNPLLSLQGRVPGLLVTQTSGIAGSGIVVRIQGQNSIVNGNTPFYVIDGVPIQSAIPIASSSQSPILGDSGDKGRGSALNFINPNDIESIEVLKDADATAIYGSRAANGAILITTKKGSVGKTKVDVNVQHGLGEVANRVKLLNTKQYLEMRNEAFKNDGLIPSSDPNDDGSNGKLYAPDLTIWDADRETNWQNELIGGTSQFSNFNGSISGGIPSLQYRIGGNYRRETTVFPGDFSDEKGSVNINMNNSSSGKKFKFQINANYTSDNNRLPQFDLTDIALLLAPNSPEIYDEFGQLNWAKNSLGSSTWVNPLAAPTYKKFTVKTNALITNLNTSFDITDEVKIALNAGQNTFNSRDLGTFALQAEKPENRITGQRSAIYGESYSNTWSVEPQISFKKSYKYGKIDLLLGSTLQGTYTNANAFSGRGYTSDEVLENPTAAASVQSGGSLITQYRYSGLFARANYSLKDRYILNLTGRRDGSSRFGESNRFNSFYGIAGAWIFSEESFIKKNLPALYFAKLKASFGTTGSDQIGDYKYLALYNSVITGIPYQGSNGSIPGGDIPNPYLEWEETRKLNLGIELGILKNHVLFSANYGRNRSSNQLINYSLPRITGRNSIRMNLPALLENTNLELSLTTTNIDKPNFYWSTNFNITFAKNKLVKFDGLARTSYASILVLGEPIDSRNYFKYYGVDPTSGLYQVQTFNGSPTSSPNYSKDLTEAISVTPTYFGGFQNTIRYRRLNLDFFIQFVKQTGYAPIYSNSRAWAPGNFFIDEGGNQPITVLDRWQNAGDIKTIQKYSVVNSNADESLGASLYSNAAYSDASYARLKNVSISYDIPDNFIKKLKLESLKISFQAQNLFTITNYKGIDPESISLSSLPPLRILALGLQVGL